jgi:hypothetical protein
VYKECVDVGLSPLLTREVREEDASERETGETPQVVCPAERIVQVGFHPREIRRGGREQEVTTKSRGIEPLADDCFDKD